ncbi:hypothetical protein [Bradyrhizobium tropiciagri]|uniref:hypothetical protein n=1 Tax=Bradyrhizobium tropiciagri TaxID=312253 RepID=UPI00067E16F9|nr:hypothetical protein [Bradyrhizobium tropiciagri]
MNPAPNVDRAAQITARWITPEPFDEMNELFHGTERQDRSHRFAERTVIGIVIAMVICLALIVWIFPTH